MNAKHIIVAGNGVGLNAATPLHILQDSGNLTR
jgi:hypothetical protein